MLYLQATKKSLAVLGLDREALAPPGETESALGNWVLNVVPIHKREAFLFMSSASLLSFPMLLGERTPEAHDLGSFLAHGIKQLTSVMRTPRSQSSLLMQDLEKVALCSANDKSIIGVHSAIAGEYMARVLAAGGLEKANLGEVIFAINSTPRATLGGRHSFEVTQGLLRKSVA